MAKLEETSPVGLGRTLVADEGHALVRAANVATDQNPNAQGDGDDLQTVVSQTVAELSRVDSRFDDYVLNSFFNSNFNRLSGELESSVDAVEARLDGGEFVTNLEDIANRATINSRIDGVDRKVDTIIKVSPFFVAGDIAARNIHISFENPANAYREASSIHVSVQGNILTSQTYNPASAHQVFDFGITATQMNNLSDGGHLDAGDYVDVEISLRNGSTVHFIRNFYVAVVAAPPSLTGTLESRPITVATGTTNYTLAANENEFQVLVTNDSGIYSEIITLAALTATNQTFRLDSHNPSVDRVNTDRNQIELLVRRTTATSRVVSVALTRSPTGASISAVYGRSINIVEA